MHMESTHWGQAVAIRYTMQSTRTFTTVQWRLAAAETSSTEQSNASDHVSVIQRDSNSHAEFYS